MVDESESAALSERFRALWTRCLLPQATANASLVFRDLLLRYSAPVRCYHSVRHVVHCLHEFDRVAGCVDNPDAVELALWFHDAVFVPGDANNEARSADLFRQWADASFRPNLVETICALILVTTHTGLPDRGDESYIVDIDLSSFGVAWKEFKRDTLRIRNERPDVPDAVYYPAHVKFLQRLLDRPHIFHTDFFRNRYEETARRNIERLLAAEVFAGGAPDPGGTPRS
jgi:predicted metal-dependent HD superfamily phosphohydrolase